MNIWRIGTRDSALALWQAEWVRDRLEGVYPEQEFVLVPVKTKGDKILDVPLAKIGDKGLFTKELEAALLRGEIDLAVHSLKDLPTVLPDGLVIAAYCAREEARDVFLGRGGAGLRDLPWGAIIGTSSLRRKAQLRYFRPDLRFSDLRGNLQTRWRKLEESEMAGIVLAAAGVKRLGWEERITEVIPEEIVLPAVGQGSIAVEIAASRRDMKEKLNRLNHRETEQAVVAERALMRRLEGGCQVPIGALARLEADKIRLKAMVASLDGTRILRAQTYGDNPATVGLEAAERLLGQGAGEILAALK
ncbi:hydroxymethylbilane synthase [Acididesulfobacillus acetoxydans]|uniref:Porphobilinogen deaminase n=1 Tax=Acididesulfobacillus acetoxydans TaxID=1561005 RepID=A0A8S0W8D1_9FIRM|nr:hydroxymethylbilane synthase [Acididesulfobacillus acetoxydans]CAA7601749.1 hydroxymethylbilane synthase [Acididesulfobacillus acetoxydans]CEJ09032.1 Porphobilinogen deaminase [Acididesulfobacillus acetoxydans]